MLSSDQPYQYDQLPPRHVFRYLILLPGTGDAPLRCYIRTAPFSQTRYVALSYVWGNPTKSHVIHCEKCIIKITENLYTALQHMRLPDQPLSLWADSICINQNNFDEKAHQVTLMGSIYRAAESVFLFMGLDDGSQGPSVSRLIKNVHRMIQETCQEIDIAWDAFPYPDEEDAIMNDVGWEHLRTLLGQSWFDRGWVVQEAALARRGEVSWGQSRFGWDELMCTYLWLSTRGTSVYHDQSFSGVQINAHVDNYLQRNKELAKLFYSELSWEPPSLLHTLSSAKELDLSDAHDRIYAFMDLPGREIAVTPDYRVSYLETYLQFAVRYIERTRNTELLDCICHDSSLPSEIPSWVPRWDISTWPLTYNCSASTTMKPGDTSVIEQPIIDHENKILKVHGVLIDSVAYVSDVFDWDSTTYETFLEVWKRVKSSTVGSPYFDQELGFNYLLDAFLDALSAGHFDGEFEDWRKSRTSFACDAHLSLNETDDDASSLDNTAGVGEEPDMYFSVIRGRTHHRRFVLTERGYMGLAPAITQEGDTCGIIFGCRMPYILRMRTDIGAYSLVGSAALMAKDCYDPTSGNGAMFCDILGEDDSRDWLEWNITEQTILLC